MAQGMPEAQTQLHSQKSVDLYLQIEDTVEHTCWSREQLPSQCS